MILFIDDEEELLKILISITKDMDIIAKSCTSATEGLNILQNEPIDVVISDISMPKLDGLEFMREARNLGFYLPFIIITGYADKETSVKALRLGTFDFLEKPFEIEVVRKTINQAVATSKSAQRILKQFQASMGNKQMENEDIVRLMELATHISHKNTRFQPSN